MRDIKWDAQYFMNENGELSLIVTDTTEYQKQPTMEDDILLRIAEDKLIFKNSTTMEDKTLNEKIITILRYDDVEQESANEIMKIILSEIEKAFYAGYKRCKIEQENETCGWDLLSTTPDKEEYINLVIK